MKGSWAFFFRPFLPLDNLLFLAGSRSVPLLAGIGEMSSGPGQDSLERLNNLVEGYTHLPTAIVLDLLLLVTLRIDVDVQMSRFEWIFQLFKGRRVIKPYSAVQLGLGPKLT